MTGSNPAGKRLLLVAVHGDRCGVGVGHCPDVGRAQQWPEQEKQRDGDEQRCEQPEDEHR